VAGDTQSQSSAFARGAEAIAHHGVRNGNGRRQRLLHSLRPKMSEKIKPLSEETDVETLRAAIAEYQWLANVLFKSLGCGCNGTQDLCWNCTQAERHYKHTIETYK